VQEKNICNVCTWAIALSSHVVQDKNAHGGVKKLLYMHGNFPCGGSKYNAVVVEDLN